MPGLIGTGLNYRQQAETLASQSDKLSQNRVQEEMMKKQAETQQKVGLTTTGATVGSYFGPWGALIGAAAGYLGSELF